MKLSLIRTITIPEFVTYVKLSESQRAKYLDDDKTILANPTKVGKPKFKKINGQELYVYGTSGNFDLSACIDRIRDNIMEYLIKEEPITEFPLVIRIRYHHVPYQDKLRAKDGIVGFSENVMKAIKGKSVDTLIDEAMWDIGNQGIIWSKVFDDCLKRFKPTRITKKNGKQVEKYKHWQGLIPDDRLKYVRGTGEIIFIPVDKYEKRKIVFKIYKII